MRGFYFITDHALSRAGLEQDVREAVRAGCPLIQYRRKEADTRTMVEEARALQALCAGTASRFIVNDRLDVALAAEADGVHLGQQDMPYRDARRLLGPDRLIGVSVHDVAEALEAETQGADYLGVGPIFTSTVKLDAGPARGVDALRAIRQATRLPLAAIGGITLASVPGLLAAGADMVCAISAVVDRPDLGATIRQFQKEFER